MDDRATWGASFGEEHFGAAQLGDQRRTKRLTQLADRMVRHPGGTLPEKIDDPASLKALYRLMDCEEVTHCPGWLVLWRGWTKLQAMAEHASALERERCG